MSADERAARRGYRLATRRLAVLREGYDAWARQRGETPSFAVTASHAAAAMGVLTRGSSSVTEWHLEDVDTFAAVLLLLENRRIAAGMLVAVILLACFLAETGRWTGSRAELIQALETLGALRSRFESEGLESTAGRQR